MPIECGSTLQPMLDKLSLWHELEPDDRKAILNLPFRTQSIERYGYIAHERDRTTHSCLMISGFSIRHKIIGNGARQIVAIHMQGDIVDLQNSFLGIADHSVQVLTESEVAYIPRDAVKRIAFERPAV